MGLAVCAVMLPAKVQAADLCNNTNPQAVFNKPPVPRAPCHLIRAAHITQLVTYHWYNGLGAQPGNISLSGASHYGPFKAVGSPGQNGAPNVNWTADVNIVVPAGNYFIIDSEPATWSWNAGTGSYGFAIVRGDYTTVSEAPPAPPVFGKPPPSGGSTCPQGPKGAQIGLLHCACNYPVGWNTPNVNVTNPGLKKWYPDCKPPLQCLGNQPGAAFAASSCQ
jgi:hypothetical protein